MYVELPRPDFKMSKHCFFLTLSIVHLDVSGSSASAHSCSTICLVWCHSWFSTPGSLDWVLNSFYQQPCLLHPLAHAFSSRLGSSALPIVCYCLPMPCNIFSPFCLCICVCMYVCACSSVCRGKCVGRYVCTEVHIEAKGQLWLSSLSHYQFGFWQFLSALVLRWLASESQASTSPRQLSFEMVL